MNACRRSNRRTAAGIAVLIVVLAAQNALPTDKTSLWKVSSAKGTAYLLGSIHLLTQDDYPLDTRMERAFDDAQVVVFEVDPDSLQSPSIQSYILENAMCREGETLQSILGDSVWTVASEKSDSLGIDIGLLSSFKPWFVALTMTLAELQKQGLDPQGGVEMHFARKAKETGKAVSALETARYQLGLFVDLGIDEQRDLLLHTLTQLEDIDNEFTKILVAWRGGSLDDLQETLNESFTAYPDIYEKLIIQRNLNWVRQIETFLESGKTHLVIVGVAHMPGDRGLIELLRQQGLKVEQL
jgi:uncharacterized protein YbaP (TraB family)